MGQKNGPVMGGIQPMESVAPLSGHDKSMKSREITPSRREVAQRGDWVVDATGIEPVAPSV